MRPGERRSARKAAKPVPTFGDIAQLVITDAQSKSTNTKVRYQWERHLGPANFGAPAGATVPHAVVEQAMGHQVGTQIERAYRRTDVLDKHRQLMRHGRSGASGMRLDGTTRDPFGNRKPPRRLAMRRPDFS